MNTNGVWTSILQWSLAHAGDDDARVAEPMSEERRNFLKAALESVQVADPAQSMRTKLEVLNAVEAVDGAPAELMHQKAKALEYLIDDVENVDNANDFVGMGGVKTLASLLKFWFDSNPEMFSGCCRVLGYVTQNNPRAQSEAVETCDVFPVLVEFLKSPRVVEDSHRAAALFALASTARSYDEGTKKFLKLKGLKVLCDECLVGDANSKTFKKALFFLRYLVESTPAILPASAKYVLPLLCSIAVVEDDNFVEIAVAYATNSAVRKIALVEIESLKRACASVPRISKAIESTPEPMLALKM